MSDVQTLTSSARDSESAAAFARWAAAALQPTLDQGPGGTPSSPLASAAPVAPATEARMLSAGMPAAAALQQDPLSWLASLSDQTNPVVFEATPAGDVQHVRDLSPSILGAYQVRQGHVELAGCTLEPRPFLRLTFPASQPDRLHHRWFGGDGQPLEAELTRRLGLTQLQPAAARLRDGDGAMIQQWIEAALAACQAAGQSELIEAGRLLAATVAWCRWASGKVAISFTSGQRVEIPFEGWAIEFRTNRLLPLPYCCAESGLASHHLCALDDGTVTVVEALGRCEESGVETLAARLGTCEVTGRRVLKERMVCCPISGKPMLPREAARCQWCDRRVAPDQLQDGRCGDCRHGAPIAVPRDDRLLQQLVTQQPALARYTRWRGWRNEQVAVLIGARWGGEVVVICDAPSGRIRRQAHRGRLLRRWHWQPAVG